MLFEGTDKTTSETKNGWYWLGSSYISTGPDLAYFDLRKVNNEFVSRTDLYISNGQFSNDKTGSGKYGVRPAVTLRSDVEIDGTGDVYTIQ